MFLCCPFVLHSRSVWTVSSHFEYLENWSCGLDVTWQPVRRDFTMHAWTVTLPWGKSVGSEIPLSELVYCVIVAFKMTKRLDQRICIKFCFIRGHSSADTIRMIKKTFWVWFSEWTPDKIVLVMLQRWPGIRWKQSHSGRPSTSKKPEIVECVQTAINENQRLTLQELEEDLGIPRTIVSEILLEDLSKKRGSKICSAAPVTRAEGISRWSCTGHAWNHLQRPIFPQKGHNWRWVMGLWLWPWNKCPFFPLEVAWVFMSKEGTAKVEQHHGHVDSFLCVCVYIYTGKVVSTKSTLTRPENN